MAKIGGFPKPICRLCLWISPTVSAEIPVGPKWCEIRQIVFGWTTQKFPFNVKTAHTLKFRGQHVISVTGKAFYDIAHAPADRSNRRAHPKDYAVWEIHPVMALYVDQWPGSVIW